jgi:hypothetical protein
MRNLRRASLLALSSLTFAALLNSIPALGQAPASKTPDLTGIWQAFNTANWDLQAHAAEPGPDPAIGAIGAIAPGPGVVEGGAAAAKRKQNFKNRWSADPEIKCFVPNVPRATYMQYRFQIIQANPEGDK